MKFLCVQSLLTSPSLLLSLSSSAGPLCADGFSPASSSALFLSHSVYSFNDLVHSQELSYTFTWLSHRSELLSKLQIHRLDAYSLAFSMDAASYIKLTFRIPASPSVLLLMVLFQRDHNFCWKSPSHFCFLCTLSIHHWSVHASFSLSTLSFSAAAADSVRQNLVLGSLL